MEKEAWMAGGNRERYLLTHRTAINSTKMRNGRALKIYARSKDGDRIYGFYDPKTHEWFC